MSNTYTECSKCGENPAVLDSELCAECAKLNDFQIIARDAYAGGEFQHVESVEQGETVGDTLFLFIMRELSSDEDCTTRETAIRRMEKAASELEDVIDALRANRFQR